MSVLANSNAMTAQGGGYTISNSLRFQSASTQYLNRTFGTPTSSTTWTWSGWVKIGTINTYKHLIYAQETSSSNRTQLYFSNSNELVFVSVDNNVISLNLVTTQVFRDPSAWYHIVLAFDTTQATASNRVKIYVNGSQVTAFSSATYPAQNYATARWNKSGIVGYHGTSLVAGEYLDGYLAEVNFIDGQALTSSSFGETDVLTGVWVAKKYAGTYGTNGFYLKFNDGTSTTTLGQDRSGNANNWTLTNFTRSAGVSDCWMYDVPSGNGSPSATQPSSNYELLNPLEWRSNKVTPSNANLTVTIASGANGWFGAKGNMGVTSGKWYWECTIGTIQSGAGSWIGIGVVADLVNWPSGTALGANNSGYEYLNDAYKWGNAVAPSSYGATYTTNDVIGVALDADGQTITFYKNGVSQGTAFSTIGSGNNWLPAIEFYRSNTTSQTVHYNGGQRSFAYTPPSGFVALCTANLPVATIKRGNQYMDATLYTGNGGTQNIVNAAGFSPDMVWIKARSSAQTHSLTDSVRGVNSQLFSNLTNAQGTQTDQVTSFNSGGFSLGANAAGTGGTNTNTVTYVGWQWQAGQGSTSSNTSGSITSTVSVSTTAGFSVVTYTTPTSGTGTIGHGLGIAPSMIITKNRNGTIAWNVYHKSLGNTQYVLLNSTVASATLSTLWNSTSPTSSVFSIGTSFANTGTYVAYCFAEIAGFSKIGSYTGNGSTDGPFVYCGFRPKYLMTKRTDTTGSWVVHDTSRSTENASQKALYPNLADAEFSPANAFDILSNGFKLRNSAAESNALSGTYIFMAFAESPFNYSNAR